MLTLKTRQREEVGTYMPMVSFTQFITEKLQEDDQSLVKHLKPIKQGFPIKNGIRSTTYMPFTNTKLHNKNLNKPNLIDSKNPVTHDEKNALSIYANDSDVNIPLRGKEKLSSDNLKISNNISNAIGKHKTKQDMYLYRGIYRKQVDELLNHMKTNSVNPKILHDHGFGGFSLNHWSTKAFAETMVNKKNMKKYTHVLKVHVPEGSRGVHMYPITRIFKIEQEFLLDKDHKIAVHPKPTFDNKKGLVTWHGNLIHDGTDWTRHIDIEKK